MADKPDTLPKWAEDNIVDPISGVNNVTEPPEEFQLNGWPSKFFPVRQWVNWLGRYTYRWLAWLKQQEEQAVVTNGDGEGLFSINDALISYYAVDKQDPTHFIMAVGYKGAGDNAVLNVVANDTLTLNTGGFTTTGDSPIDLSTVTDNNPDNVIIWGQSKIIQS